MDLPQTPSFQLSGKRAFVAGASSGIGLASATALAQAGAEVTLAARSKDKLTEIKTAFDAAGYASEILTLDITDISATQSAIEARDPFDILVNSAGFAKHSPAIDTVEADYDTVMNINVKAAYFLTTAIARKLIEAGKGGSLINISSQMGLVGGIDRAVYCASKHAVEGFTKSMAIEWGKHQIRVNTICPTFIRTPLAEQTLQNPDRLQWLMEKIKLGRIGEVSDIMGAVVYLASDASAMMTGTHLLIDGGWTAE